MGETTGSEEHQTQRRRVLEELGYFGPTEIQDIVDAAQERHVSVVTLIRCAVLDDILR